jgi:AsmA protein
VNRWAKIGLLVVAIVVLIIVTIPLFVNVNTFRPVIEKEVTNTLGRSVKIGELSFSVLSGGIAGENLSVADDPAFSANPFLTAKTLTIGVSLWPLIFSHEMKLRSLAIDSPQINLIRASNGTWNFSSIGHAAWPKGANRGSATASLPKFFVDLITIEDGRATITAVPAGGEASVYQHVKIEVHNFSFGSQFPLELRVDLPGDGSVNARGKVGPINRDDAAASPVQMQVSVKHVDLVAAGFLDPAAGVSLLADIETKAESDGAALAFSGSARIENLKLRKSANALSKPVDASFSGTHQLKNNSGQIQDASIELGDSALHVSGTYQPVSKEASDPLLDLKLVGENVPINEVQPLMSAAAVRLPNGSTLKGGTVSLHLAIRGQPKVLAITGPLALDNTRLVGFDIGSKIHGIAALSGVKTGDTTEFQKLSMFVRMTNTGVVAEKIEAVVAGMGELTGSGTVSPSDQLDFNLTVKGAQVKGIGKVGIGILSTFSGGSGSKSSIPIHVAGTSEEPYITADVGGMFGIKSKPSGKKN